MSLKKAVLLCAFLALFASTADAQRKMVCYWMAGMAANTIDGNLCTHILYSFMGLDAAGNLNHLWRTEAQGLGYIAELRALRSAFPHLHIIVAMGGWNEPLVPVWSAMAASPTARANFANNCLQLCQQQQLDGIDIDWEYPNFDGNAPQDIQNFVLLLQQLRSTLGPYELSIAIGAGEWRTNLSYDIPAIFPIVDFVGLMTYDMTGGWNSVTGVHSALFAGPNDQSGANGDAAVNTILSRGATREKIIYGIPTYGNAFNLASAVNNGVGAPVTGGAAGLPYRTICQRLNVGTLTAQWEATQLVPYAYQGTFWIGYDNTQSAIHKANYINQNNLGGAMFWVLDDDDIFNTCGQGTFPIFRTVRNLI